MELYERMPGKKRKRAGWRASWDSIRRWVAWFWRREAVEPLVLEILVDHFGGSRYQARLAAGRVIYGQGPFGRDEIVDPAPEAWRRFRAALDAVGVWDWRAEYYMPACDGTSWAVKIRYADREIESWGSNGYPGTEGADESQEFAAFLAAVRDLLGGRELR
ncbi:MAG: hypothetical protein ACM3ZC_16325 [Bacteroidota bacterium]